MKESAPPVGRGRLRRLSDEEIALWLAVTKTISPRRSSILPEPTKLKPELAPELPAPVAASAKGASAKNRAATPPAAISAPPLAPLERRMRQKLSRGRMAPDAAIDLHGLRAHEASLALRQFLVRAQLDGAKIVLVVTGKGRGGAGTPGEEEAGVLRRSVPHWLRAHDYASIVVGFEEASRPHGGAGALYVRIRRPRLRRD
ncbi:Smr protein/MutS2 [Methylocella silvestris BL2]|uniref:Smr protein/MutS2 n=2 Tax=Methylocella silvestris TaxID=199596 RepID=B8ENI2_METSB|nr:Smr protein/MutS2 [Methylocella silvestris BL2]